MAPLICLIVAFLFFRILGLEWRYFSDWHLALRAALGAMFLLTASAHWGRRRADLIRMVPESVGNPGARPVASQDFGKTGNAKTTSCNGPALARNFMRENRPLEIPGLAPLTQSPSGPRRGRDL